MRRRTLLIYCFSLPEKRTFVCTMMIRIYHLCGVLNSLYIHIYNYVLYMYMYINMYYMYIYVEIFFFRNSSVYC